MTVRVVQVGLGPIGIAVARQISQREGFELSAAIDNDPEKIGRDVGEICGADDGHAGILVAGEFDRATADASDVAVVCTSSSLAALLPVAGKIMGLGLPIVSTTEELAYPFYAQAELARELDARATAAGVAILGTGVNPGFAMDTLALVLTAPCERVDAIRIERYQDAGRRRIPFQRKVGAGLEEEEFRSLVVAGRMGHVGFTESVAMIGAAMGWELDRIEDDVEPKLAERSTHCDLGTIAAGRVAGIVQHATGFRDGDALIELHMEAYIGAPESYDAVHIAGSPTFTSRVDGGFPGDIATASITVNAIRRVLAARPGLRTMSDLAPPACWSGG